MKKILTLLCAAAVFYSCEDKKQEGTTAEAGTTSDLNQTTTQPAALTQDELVERGKYLVAVGSCNDCHSPKLAPTDKIPPMTPDPSRLLSGHPASDKVPPVLAGAAKSGWHLFSMDNTVGVGPWGTSFSANLTPDATGIGNWTIDNFKTALRKGKYKGMENGRTLLPPMPWPNYRNMTDQDLEAIFAYLKSLPPIKNVVPAPIPPAGA
ncbi:hypothetical protein TH63_17495 [Rufibacter radiotolerans]|uniref:Cytochrome c domain-containing protein n=1 Tax=Rufibacter radiotolerans TaxID=1379910 RepID=A0A0H4VMD9_9BACT|nr:c-type cytochrome [Rufibacter radiotolerans]AKQ47030.1 hypothetical protein TH63_17495 [Rufibacter radiotolerans]